MAAGFSGELRECSAARASLQPGEEGAPRASIAIIEPVAELKKSAKAVPRSGFGASFDRRGAAADGGNRAVAKNRVDDAAASRRGMTRS